MLESSIRRDEHIAFQLLHQHMVFQMLPAEIKERLHLLSSERLGQAWIDGGVYDDAHNSWSIAMSRVSSRKAKTCCLGIAG